MSKYKQGDYVARTEVNCDGDLCRVVFKVLDVAPLSFGQFALHLYSAELFRELQFDGSVEPATEAEIAEYEAAMRELTAAVERRFRLRASLFVGVYPTGIMYADKMQEKSGEYHRVAFLFFDTLELKINDEDSRLLPLIREDAAKIQSRRGEEYQVATCGQTVLLGGKD